MRLEAVRLRDVRGFGAAGVAVEGLGKGLNVLSAPNEFGKSTLFDAVRAALFHKHTTTHRDVKSLEPDPGGGNPEVTLEVVTPEGRFRIEKWFLRKRMARVTDIGTGRVIAEADDAERWIRALIGADKPGQGPTGLLWVEQGASLRQPDGGEGRGDVVFNALGHEVAEVTGGERARRVLARAQERLDKLVTRERRSPKAGAPYRAAADRAEALEAERGELVAKVRASRAVREQLAAAEDELTRLSEGDEAARGAELAEARAKLSAAEGAAARLEALAETARRASADEAAAREAVTARAGAEDEARAFFAAEAAAGDRTQARARKVAEAQTRLAAASETSRAATEALQAARDAATAAAAHRDAERAAEDLNRVRRTLNEARTARGALDALPPDEAPPDIRALEEAAARLAAAEARADAVSLRLVVERAEEAMMNGAALAPGTVILGETTRLEAPGFAARIEGPTQRESEAAEAAKATLNRMLSEAGAADVAAAREKADALAERKRERRALRETLARLAPDGLGVLERQEAALAEAARPAAAPAPEGDPQMALTSAETAAAQAGGAVEAARAQLDEARAKEAAAREAAARDGARAEQARARLGAEEAWPAARTALEEAIGKTAAAAEAARASLGQARADSPDPDAARAEVDRLAQAERNRQERSLHLNREVARLRADLQRDRAEGAEERLAAVAGELEAAREDAARYAREAEALQLLIDTLSGAQSERRETFFGPVAQEIAPLLAAVFENGALSLGDDLSPEGLSRDGLAEDVGRLSGGTREQLAIITRLGFARLMAKAGRPMPVVLDDALVFADDARIRRMFTALNLAARDVQVLALTCRQAAFEGLGGRILTPVPLETSPMHTDL